MANYLDKLNGIIRAKCLGDGVKGELVNLSPLRDNAVIPGFQQAAIAASAAVTNTITETVFSTGSYSILANTLRAGSVIRVTFQGTVTSVNATDTLAINLRIGGVAGTVVLALAARNGAANDIFAGFAELVVRTTGSSGTVVGFGFSPTNENVAGTAVGMRSLASTAIDTTVAQAVVVSAVWSVANAADSCRLDIFNVEIA